MSLRPNEYASNFLGLWAAQLRSGNVIRAPYGASQHAPIDERDIAAVAVEALLTDRLSDRRCRCRVGSRSARELAGRAGQALGRPIRFEEIHRRWPARRCWLKVSPKASSPACCCRPEAVDRPALVTHTVEEILGRPATGFATWAADHAESFRRMAA